MTIITAAAPGVPDPISLVHRMLIVLRIEDVQRDAEHEGQERQDPASQSAPAPCGPVPAALSRNRSRIMSVFSSTSARLPPLSFWMSTAVAIILRSCRGTREAGFPSPTRSSRPIFCSSKQMRNSVPRGSGALLCHKPMAATRLWPARIRLPSDQAPRGNALLKFALKRFDRFGTAHIKAAQIQQMHPTSRANRNCSVRK